jgi:AMP nucleosidase
MTSLPLFIAPAAFDTAEAALAQVQAIYRSSIEHLRENLAASSLVRPLASTFRACYPFRPRPHRHGRARADSRLSYGFVAGPGNFEITSPGPTCSATTTSSNFSLLLQNHSVAIEVGTSAQPIPGALLAGRTRPPRRAA